jgi:hypothetical protein
MARARPKQAAGGLALGAAAAETPVEAPAEVTAAGRSVATA